MFKRILAAASAVLLGVGIAVVGISPASATETCPDGVDGWVKIEPIDALTYTATAPAGFLIVETCYKAADHPPVYDVVDPPASSYDFESTLLNPPGNAYQDISHVSIKLVAVVSGAVTPEDQMCTDEELTGGYITPTPTTGVTYELYEDDGSGSAAGTLIDGDFDAKSGELAPGIYWVKVLPASDAYFVSEENTWIKVTINAYEGECDDEAQEVSGAATPEAQTCTENFELEGGYITPTPTTGVVYELYADDGSESAAGALIDGDFDAKSGELAPGVYWVKVLPASADYTVSEANTWIKVVVDPYDGICIPTLSVVEVKFSSTQPTCEVLQGSFRFGLAPDQGEPESAIEWTVDTGSGPQPGTPGVVYTANAGTSVTVVATATKGYGLSGDEDGVITFGPVTFTAADDCLPTLPLTGAEPNGMIGFAAAMVVLGGLVLAAARRQTVLQRD